MRKIRFRLWCEGEGQYKDSAWLLDGHSGKTFDQKGYCEHDEGHVLEQFTGYRDRNDVDVYEGDVVTHPWRFSDGKSQVVYIPPKFLLFDGDDSVCDNIPLTECEVIGNIHEEVV